MSGWQCFFLTVSVAFELGGLTFAVLGLRKTWREHAADQRLIPAMWAELGALVLRRHRVEAHSGSAWGRTSTRAKAHGVRPFPPDATTEEKLVQLKETLDLVNATAADAKDVATETRDELRRTSDDLCQQITRLGSDIEVKVRAVALDGLPLAIFGLALTIVGAMLQYVSTFM